MRIRLYVGEYGWNWLNDVDPDRHEEANNVVQWLAIQALKRYGDVEVARRGLYGHDVECYEDDGTRDVKMEESLKETIDQIVELFLDNLGFWFTVPVPWEPYLCCKYDAFLRLEEVGEIQLVEPRIDQAAQGLCALTDLSDESWVGQVAKVSADSFPEVRVGDYVVCDGIGAPVRFYRVD